MGTPEKRLSPSLTGMRAGLLIGAGALTAGVTTPLAAIHVYDMLHSTNQDIATAAKPEGAKASELSNLKALEASLEAGGKQRLAGDLLDLDLRCKRRRAITSDNVANILMGSQPLNEVCLEIMEGTLHGIQRFCLLDSLTSNTSKAKASDLPPSILATLQSTEEGRKALEILRASEARQGSSSEQE